ncbi:ABC transporter permease [candidate division KSB1 bacterium]|nr:ABC transporter permease [candidate division KSB1 bacterium]
MSSYEVYIALRYLRSKKRTGFISLITYISVAGVAVGVAALIIVLSVLNGFETEVRSRFIGISSHLQIRDKSRAGIEKYDKILDLLKNQPDIVALTPFIEDKALIMSSEASTGFVLRGIEPETAVKVSGIIENINFGNLELGKTEIEGRELPGIVLGYALADQMVVTLGDIVTVYSLTGMKNMDQLPYFKQFFVTGYFETGLNEFDSNMAYVSIESAQKVFRLGQRVTGIEMRLKDHYKAKRTAKKLSEVLDGSVDILTWFDMNRNLFAAMQLEKIAAFVILSLIVMVAAFNIVSTMSMVTMEKTQEIGILKSMGATRQSIRRIFTFEGLLVGITGTTIGIVFGYGFCWAQMTWKFFALPSNLYIIPSLPVLVKWPDFFMIGIASILITFIAAIYPAQKAAKMDPVKSIRNE